MSAARTELAPDEKAASRWEATLANLARAAGPPLLFGLRLWAAVCLALYVAFWLQLDNPFWAGYSAATISQPQLGASLRKGWFRMIGTPVGAVAIVVLTACFPQDRALFLISLGLWTAACTFVSTLLRNFAAYSAALAGYTAVIIAGDELGASGGVNADAVFMLAVTRFSEISIGIVAAGVVLAGTDLGTARRRLAALIADLTTGIMASFARTLASAGLGLPDTQSLRRDFIRRVIALDPVIDQTIGESTQIRYHSPVLQRAVHGLLTALSGWRAIANHLARLPDRQASAEAAPVLQCLPSELLTAAERSDSTRRNLDPTGLGRMCQAAGNRLFSLQAGTPSQRLLADKTAEALIGISHALNGLALLVTDPAQPPPRYRGVFRLRVPNWLPALVNAGRTFVTIGAVALFWIITAWPNGAGAIEFAAIGAILMAPRADQAYIQAMRFMVGVSLAALFAATMAFGVLPAMDGFSAFAVAMGFYLVPAGALAAQPWQRAVFSPMATLFTVILGPTNEMSYDTAHFYNGAVGIVAGLGAAALSFRLLPQPSPAFWTHRLLRLTLRDLRRLAAREPFADWEEHIHGRLTAMPAQATPLQRARLLAALSLGTEIIRLRSVARRFDLGAHLEVALAAMAQGKSATAIRRIKRLDAALANHASDPGALGGRGSIVAISEMLTLHADYFDAGAQR